ncbi:polyunsaturated fatty acid 5-lipoxygenase-like [Ptychodera flava]|uniref:polyunsaturated fatty acid 5-lipoxygenase-like n=1 Tax=Ptychodera flava TaxID=63121 RepID=UPI00396A095C
MGNSCTKNSTPPSDYMVYVTTGDHKGSGTDANVFIAFHNGDGVRSRDLQLDSTWKDDFERGRVDRFPISNLANFGAVKKIEIWRDESGITESDWYVDVVEVVNTSTKKRYFFPVQRWVTSKHLLLQEFDSLLPPDDPHLEQRLEELDRKKELYCFESKSKGLPAQIKECPRDQQFSDDYKWDIVTKKSKLLLQSKITAMTTAHWDSLDDLINVYGSNMPRPAGVSNWKKDIEFGMQRLTGCNPTVIRLCTEIPENLGVTDEMLQPLLEDLSLEDAINQKRLYIINYEVLQDLQCTEDRKICAPIALFFVNSEKEFLPVAIQLFQDKSDSNPVFLPSDPEYTWMLAKMHFNNADASVHQSCTHLGFTHLVMESVAVCTNRNLSPSHPLFRLLAPHFLYLIAINSLALAKLVAPGGWVDKCMTVGRTGMFGIMARMFTKWRLDVQGTLPADLSQRGVSDPEALPNYHYRDDALLLYEATKKYVTAVVTSHYDNSDKITTDGELQAWAKELTTPIPEGFGFQGVPGNGSFTTVDEIIQTMTSIIFISSVGHAASNFSQYDEYGFPPNYPGMLRGDPPTSKEPVSEKAILDQLPNKEQTLDVMLVTMILSDRGTNALTDFEVKYQYDPIGENAVKDFKKELKTIEGIITSRNKTRATPYPYLDPREVPNAISI